jgi:hypothetical protein
MIAMVAKVQAASEGCLTRGSLTAIRKRCDRQETARKTIPASEGYSMPDEGGPSSGSKNGG